MSGQAAVPAGRVGLVGFGRFGRAFAGLLAESRFAVRAFDPAGVPPEFRASSVRGVAEWARTVVLAVPVAATRSVLLELRPALSPDHLVLEVGSVKTAPIAAMTEVLGPAVPWIGTHPLFGPASLALGERPLNVVICPNPLHPAAFGPAESLFRAVGCHVIVLDAEAHDRAMADTHALAYFVAKGLLDAGVQLDTELAPPSARGLARTIASVRADAGHLFTTLHRDNPFSAAARRRFLDALHEADHALKHPAPRGGSSSPDPELSIPDLGLQSPELREVRDLIDELDRGILELLAQRARLARRARSAKAEIGHGVRDPRREEDLLAQRQAWAAERGLDPVSVEHVFLEILRFSRRLQETGP